MGANFTESSMQETLFEQAQGRATDFSNATFNDLTFSGSTIPDALFDGASGENLSIKSSEFANAVFTNTKIAGLEISDLSIMESAKFNNAVLTSFKADNATLKNASFVDAQLVDGEITGGIMHNADFTCAKMAKVHFMPSYSSRQEAYSSIHNAKMINADLSQSVFESVDLTAVDFSGAKIDGLALENSYVIIKGQRKILTIDDLKNLGATTS